jgi:hypothetical protein
MKKQRGLPSYRTFLLYYLLDIVRQNGMGPAQIYAQIYRFKPLATL